MKSAQFSSRSLGRGFATVLAVFLIAMVAVALASIAAVLHVEAMSNRSAIADVQLRQLLLAAKPIARAALDRGDQHLRHVPVPAALAEANADLIVDVRALPTDKMDITITAKYLQFSRSQELHFAKEQDRWSLTAATLLPLQKSH